MTYERFCEMFEDDEVYYGYLRLLKSEKRRIMDNFPDDKKEGRAAVERLTMLTGEINELETFFNKKKRIDYMKFLVKDILRKGLFH